MNYQTKPQPQPRAPAIGIGDPRPVPGPRSEAIFAEEAEVMAPGLQSIALNSNSRRRSSMPRNLGA